MLIVQEKQFTDHLIRGLAIYIWTAFPLWSHKKNEWKFRTCLFAFVKAWIQAKHTYIWEITMRGCKCIKYLWPALDTKTEISKVKEFKNADSWFPFDSHYKPHFYATKWNNILLPVDTWMSYIVIVWFYFFSPCSLQKNCKLCSLKFSQVEKSLLPSIGEQERNAHETS